MRVERGRDVVGSGDCGPLERRGLQNLAVVVGGERDDVLLYEERARPRDLRAVVGEELGRRRVFVLQALGDLGPPLRLRINLLRERRHLRLRLVEHSTTEREDVVRVFVEEVPLVEEKVEEGAPGGEVAVRAGEEVVLEELRVVGEGGSGARERARRAWRVVLQGRGP